MGVPKEALPPPAGYGASKENIYMNGVDAEAIFLYHDPDKNELFLADQLPADRTNQMLKGTDAQVKMGLERMRLTAPDDREFQKYNSGGLLFDTAQATAAKSNASGQAASNSNSHGLAWSVFSALFPGTAPKGGGNSQSATGSTKSGGSGGKKGSGGKGGGSQQGQSPQSQAANLHSPSSSPLQPLEQVHTMQLPSGLGQTRLTVFVKDRRKSAFGMVVSTFGSVIAGASAVYLPLLSMGGIPQSALQSVKTLVANLHTSGDQKMVFGTPNDIPLVAARDKIPANTAHVQLVPGNYIIVRKGHLKYLSGKTTGVMMYDGYLLPKASDFATYYDQAAAFAADASYISLNVSVDAIKIKANATCTDPSAKPKA